ncbi:cupin domain-containing protein [Christiangramia crocea]|uniref:Cupin domain-containing protein n=1 Tax=Christiangramia crocea TaxID=2904124 RepID=A0A9X1UVL4_9FLAO|nr:cupin domain-containing protein [Gramella crocea]MCG9970941.1 cupin domain-containing protein [Gramella crocea]
MKILTSNFFKMFRILAFSLLFLMNGRIAFSQDHKDSKMKNHIMVNPEDIEWQKGPASLPPGAMFQVIEGDLSKKGLFTMRLKLPAGYSIQAHWHPVDEHITVISGSFKMGMGDKFDANALEHISEGGFVVMPAKSTHFATTEEGCIIQLHGQGPWQINYVNKADDPRLAK